MIQYIIAAGIGAFLGSQSKKSKKSYAHGGYARGERFGEYKSIMFGDEVGDEEIRHEQARDWMDEMGRKYNRNFEVLSLDEWLMRYQNHISKEDFQDGYRLAHGLEYRKITKSYAKGGIAYVNDDFPELVDSQTYVIDGTYGSNQTPTEVYVMELEGGGKWYAARDSVNVNYTNDSFYDGVDIETISDIDTITASKPIEYSDDLEDLIVRHYGEMLEERGDDYFAKGGEPKPVYDNL